MNDDIVTRLRNQWTNEYDATGKLLYEAEKEIERLRQALALAIGELSTHDTHRFYTPEQLYKQFLEEAQHGRSDTHIARKLYW